MYCPICGSINDEKSKFCIKCGAKIIKKIGRNPEAVKSKIKIEGTSKNTKILLVLIALLVVGIGISSGFMLNKSSSEPYATCSTDVSPSTGEITPTVASQDSPTETVTQGSQKTAQPKPKSSQPNNFSANGISFKYPSNWNNLEKNYPNKLASVGLEDYPIFIVYSESPKEETTLSNYTKGSKKQMAKKGYKLLSEDNRTVDGLDAYEMLFQGKTSEGVVVKQMCVLIETPKSNYIVLLGIDTIDEFEKSQTNFDTIIESFKLD